jgi:hypothetical protein
MHLHSSYLAGMREGSPCRFALLQKPSAQARAGSPGTPQDLAAHNNSHGATEKAEMLLMSHSELT